MGENVELPKSLKKSMNKTIERERERDYLYKFIIKVTGTKFLLRFLVFLSAVFGAEYIKSQAKMKMVFLFFLF